jgi:tripartite-type tricarboxylate transporter receptor subunit TctC
MRRGMRKSVRCLLAAWALCGPALPFAVQAQAWPQRPVQLIVPFAAGGSTDLQARIVSERLGEDLGEPFLVENRAGAGGAIAADLVARAAPDGYTLFFAASPQISILPVIQAVAYSPARDFVPISMVGMNPFVLGVGASLPVGTLTEFVEYVRRHPGELSYASGGEGSVGHLSSALLAARAGLSMTHVPYKGGALAAQALAGEQVQMYFGNPSELTPFARSGKIKLLAVSSESRWAQQPDLPALSEILPGFRTTTWNGLLAPTGTPASIVERLAKEVARIVRDPAVVERLRKIGIDPVGDTPGHFAELIRAEIPLWREAVRAAGIKAK